MDDRRGTFLPGAAEGGGAMQGVRGGDGGWINGRSHEDITWASGRVEMGLELENLGHGGITVDVPHGLPGQGSPAELPGLGMPRTSDDEAGDAGPFSSPAFSGHCDHFGGVKPPPSTVPPMQHSGPLVCVEQKAPCHCIVHHRGRAEEKAVSGGVIEGDLVEGLSGLWITFGKCDYVQVSGKGDDGGL